MVENPFRNTKALCVALKKIPWFEKDLDKRRVLSEILLNGPKSKYGIHLSLGLYIRKAQRLVDQLERKRYIKVVKTGVRGAKLYDVTSGALIFSIFHHVGCPSNAQTFLKRIITDKNDPWFFVKEYCGKIESALGGEFVPIFLEYITEAHPHVWGDRGTVARYSILNKWKMKDEEKWKSACAVLELLGYFQGDLGDLERMRREMASWQKMGRKTLEKSLQRTKS